MKRCEGTIAWQQGPFGFEPVICGQTVGIAVVHAPDGSRHYACQRHRGDVERRLERTVPSGAFTDLCRCGSRLTADGCLNADCGAWRGPVGAAR